MVFVGGILVLVAVLVGFSMAGGHVGALIHLSEFITIGGAAFGAMITMSPKKVLVDLVLAVLQVIKGSPYNKKMYVEMFKLLYGITRMIRRDGVLALEGVVGNPSGPLFKKYPSIDKDNHVKGFLCDGLAGIVDGKSDAHAQQAEFDEEIEVIEREHHAAVSVLVKTADALPGFGIVAAVLGIVVTMQAIGGPVDEIGHKVGAALVGTFLGILMSYGFFAPMAGRMEFLGDARKTFYRSMAAGLVAIGEGAAPREVVVRARRVVGNDCRPTQAELYQLYKEGEAG